jgi:hypothetical protein
MFTEFPSIGQFYQFVQTLKKITNLPSEIPSDNPFTFTGTVKLHGTNAAIGYTSAPRCGTNLSEKEKDFTDADDVSAVKDIFWIQSRTKVITVENDNYGFAKYVTENKEKMIALIRKVAARLNINLQIYSLTLFGEWCGGKIQKNVAISGLPNMFVLFDAVAIHQGNNSRVWYDLTSEDSDNTISVYNIKQFPTFTLEISLDNLNQVKEELKRITSAVEEECPVGKYFGRDKAKGDNTTGEGVVWRCEYQTEIFRFKVKGDEHATSKVVKSNATEPTISKNLEEFLNNALTENRLQQGIKEIFGNDSLDSKAFDRIGKFQQWVVHDVKKEDMAAFPFLAEYKGEKGPDEQKRVEKELNRAISNRTRKWFTDLINLG